MTCCIATNSYLREGIWYVWVRANWWNIRWRDFQKEREAFELEDLTKQLFEEMIDLRLRLNYLTSYISTIMESQTATQTQYYPMVFFQCVMCCCGCYTYFSCFWEHSWWLVIRFWLTFLDLFVALLHSRGGKSIVLLRILFFRISLYSNSIYEKN